MFRKEHNKRWQVDRQADDPTYRSNGWQEHNSVYDNRCAACWLNHTHTWNEHDGNILMNEVWNSIDQGIIKHISDIPEIQTEYLESLKHKVERFHKNLAHTNRSMVVWGYFRRGRFEFKINSERRLQKLEYMLSLLEIKYSHVSPNDVQKI